MSVSRFRPRGDSGAYAVLYAGLVVVMIAMAAIVVDLSSVRQDRRLNRSAADAAALGGAGFLLPTGTINPNLACVTAWQYLNATLQLNLSSGSITSNCSSFPTVYGSCPSDEIDQDVVVGTRTIRIAWPVPSTGGSGFLNADIAPGNIGQPFDGSSKAGDGSTAGCDRLGVAISQHQGFGLAGAFGPSGTDTQVHSVALAVVSSGPGKVIAALNVLNPKDCGTLRATGGGKVYVDPTINRDGTRSPGTIAVESSGNSNADTPRGDCSGSNTVITTNGAGARICANGINSTVTSCDGTGVIYSHALDLGRTAVAYNNADVTGGLLSPKPRAEGGTHGYAPVTALYGCNTGRLPACTPPASPLPNYISDLETAYNANPPVPYTSTQAPYLATYPFTGTFQNAAPFGACGTVSGTVALPALNVGISTGNWYCPAGSNINITGKLIIPNGNFVVQGGNLSVANGGCLIINTAATVCDTSSITGSGRTVTTNPAPTSESILYLKNGSFSAANGSSFLMPQTFLYEYGANAGAISFDATTTALWTAPGAGAEDGSGHTTLEAACYDTLKAEVNENCMNSRFGRLAFWSDFAAPSTGPSKDTFQGGSSNTFVVGVFFTPTSYFNLAGSSSLPLISQFWADILDVNGGAALPLTPTDTAAVPTPIGSVSLIR